MSAQGPGQYPEPADRLDEEERDVDPEKQRQGCEIAHSPAANPVARDLPGRRNEPHETGAKPIEERGLHARDRLMRSTSGIVEPALAAITAVAGRRGGAAVGADPGAHSAQAVIITTRA